MCPSPNHPHTSPEITNSVTQDFASCLLGLSRSPHIMPRDWHTPESRAVPAMHEEVHRAVTALHEGRRVIVGIYPTGVYREIVVLESLRDSTGAPKGLLAVATRYNGGKEQTFLGLPTLTLVYLPTPEDAAVYYLAGALSYRAGPADLYPGSVGSLELVHDPMCGIAQITQLQSSAKISEPAVSDILKRPGNSLCTKYQKWSSRLLERAFEHVRRLGISQIAVGPQSETDLPLSAPVRNVSMIRNKAEACGFTLSSDRSMLIDTSSPR
jgi:hypothetical protein